MSRVHDALRKAEQAGAIPAEKSGTAAARPAARANVPSAADGILDNLTEIAYTPLAGAHLLHPEDPKKAPAEEFRALRTRMNHLQNLQPTHTLVITSPSPAEGKSFTATNLALSQAQLEGNPTLLADFDFRRPVMHTLFQMDREPGLTDYLLGEAPLNRVIRKVEGQNLWVAPAGKPVLNPLELLNLDETKNLLAEMPRLFKWTILDTPPLLFAADANLLATLCDGALLVVRIGTTSVDSVTRAVQSLCENNLLGVVANAAHLGELYSHYAYYQAYYQHSDKSAEVPG